jgi:hypothetical protein
MRLTFFVAVTLLVHVLVLGPRAAEARPRSTDDDAVVAKLLGHADKISAILEQDLDRPKKALTTLDKYLKKHRKTMKGLVTKLVAVCGELDDDARSDLAKELMWSERTQRFLQALTAFRDKHGTDPAYQKKIDARVEELMAEGKRLVDALMQ